MFVKSFASFTLFTSLYASYASAAVVSLYVPVNVGGEGLPITADPIGTDNTGHTTWRIAVGTPSGTFTDLEGAPTSAVVTLVEGSTDVHAFANIGGVTSAREDCAIATPTASGGVPIASCVLQLADASTTVTIAGTETATPMPVQAADKTAGTSASGSGAPEPTGSGKGNGAGRMSFMGIGALAALGVTAILPVVL